MFDNVYVITNSCVVQKIFEAVILSDLCEMWWCFFLCLLTLMVDCVLSIARTGMQLFFVVKG
jgi:hypothetical protein